jgi:hypothetical protein
VDFIQLGDEAGTASTVDDLGAGTGDKAIDAVQFLNRDGRNGFTEAINLVGIEYRRRPSDGS